MAYTYRDLKVVAVAGENKSDPFYVKQRMDHPIPESKFLLRLDDNGTSNNDVPLVNTSNGEIKAFGNQNKEWLEEVLKGFRKQHEGVVYITVEVVPTMPTIDDLKGEELF